MNNAKVSKNREKKQKIVAELSDKVTHARAFVFANYQGMTHRQIEELKKALKKLNAEIVVTKNTLLARSLENVKLKAPGPLEGPTLSLFVYEDIVLPLKELAKSIKNIKLPVIKFGILEGQAINADQVLKLSTLPSREVLLAQVVGGLKSPIFGLHRALSWNIQKLVLTLKSIENSKSETRSTKQI